MSVGVMVGVEVGKAVKAGAWVTAGSAVTAGVEVSGEHPERQNAKTTGKTIRSFFINKPFREEPGNADWTRPVLRERRAARDKVQPCHITIFILRYTWIKGG